MRKVLTLNLVAGLIVASGSTAHATTRDITDPPGDVVTAIDDGRGDYTYSREGGAEGDIVFARVQHTATQVVIYLRHRQLTVPRQYLHFDFLIEGNNRQMVEAGMHMRRGDPQGDSWAYNQSGCAHSNRVNYAGDSAWMRIARACLKNPKYVRVNATTGQTRIPRSGPVREYYDNPTMDGGTISEQGDAWTPWVVTD